MWNNEKELKVHLWDAVVYLKLSFLKNKNNKNFDIIYYIYNIII